MGKGWSESSWFQSWMLWLQRALLFQQLLSNIYVALKRGWGAKENPKSFSRTQLACEWLFSPFLLIACICTRAAHNFRHKSHGCLCVCLLPVIAHFWKLFLSVLAKIISSLKRKTKPTNGIGACLLPLESSGKGRYLQNLRAESWSPVATRSNSTLLMLILKRKGIEIWTQKTNSVAASY